MNDFKHIKDERTTYANEVIKKYLPMGDEFTKELTEAMCYSVLAGGKRLRPMLIDSVYRMLGGKGKAAEPFMAAMEYLHTYSLVHDDMPEIDNDDYRRGMLTTHKRYGQACALLAGDGLLHWSTQTALEAFKLAEVSEYECLVKAMIIFAKKSGPEGMLGGQSVDVLFTGKSPDMERIEYIYRLKTCALIEGSLMIGAALAGAEDSVIDELEKAGRFIGLAFQIKDDILDCTGDEKLLGKPVGSDEKNGKTTYASNVGVEKAQKRIEELSRDAVSGIVSIQCRDEDEKQFLLWLVDSLVGRNY